VTGSHRHETLILRRIINTIRNGPAFGIAGKIVVVDQLGLLFPAGPRVLEFADPRVRAIVAILVNNVRATSDTERILRSLPHADNTGFRLE
jgi:hypothetical protein